MLCLRAIRHQYIRQQDGTTVEAPLVAIRIPPEPVKAQRNVVHEFHR
jgi:hypothetical protein